MPVEPLTLFRALRAGSDTCLALVGAGGKTIAMAQLARQLQLSGRTDSRVLLATSTHLGAWQVGIADQHFIIETPAQIAQLNTPLAGIALFTGPLDGKQRFSGLSEGSLLALRGLSVQHGIPLIIEADGSRQCPLKAPAAHEPVIPAWVKQVVVVAGLSGLGQPLREEGPAVFRAGRFTELAGAQLGDPVSAQALLKVLCHPDGGLKGIPAGAQRVALLNQADTSWHRETAMAVVDPLMEHYDQVLVASLQQQIIYSTCQPTAGILLAAGGSTRLGQPKALVEWHGRPLIRIAAESALQGGLYPLVVVLGALDQPLRAVLEGLPVHFVANPDWQAGQSTSLRVGLQAARRLLAPRVLGAAVFLLSDQPFTSPQLVRALRDEHRRGLAPVIAPYVGERRANPVLFDQVTFPDLLSLTGDSGGRAIFQRYPPTALPWTDTRLLLDIDTPADLQRLQELDATSDS